MRSSRYFRLVGIGSILSAGWLCYGPVSAEVLVRESFDYPPGSLQGRDGGVGWAGAYEEFGGHPAGEVVAPRGEEAFGAGSYARFARDSYHFRQLDTLAIPARYLNERGTVGVAGETLWVSVFLQAEEPILPPFFGISLFEGGEERLFLGRGTNETGGWKIQTEYDNVLSGEYTEAQWIVLRIDFRNDGSDGARRDGVTMFVNPDPSDPEPDASEAAGEIRRSPGPLSFNRVRFVGNGNGFRMNDFRIGTSYSAVSSAAEAGTVVTTR